MAVAAQLRALAVVDALALGLEPGLVEPPRHGVDLDAEGRHGEGVQHVRRGHLHLDHLVDRHDHLVVGGKQARLARLQILGVDHVRIEAEAAALVGRVLVGPVPGVPVVFTITSGFGMMSCSRRSRKDGIAIATRISTGRIVQATSSRVLCVVRDGTGFACSLNFTATAIRSASTNSEIAVMIQTSQVWKRCTSWATGVTGVLHGDLPRLGLAGPGRERGGRDERQGDAGSRKPDRRPMANAARPHPRLKLLSGPPPAGGAKDHNAHLSATARAPQSHAS